MRGLLICLALALAWLAPTLASAQSCVAGNPIGSFPFTPGVDRPFTPAASRVTNATFNGVAGDVLSFQANPGGGDSQVELVRSANNAIVIARVTFSASTTYSVTAVDVAQFPYQMRITNNSTANQTYVINCTVGVTQPAPTVTAVNPSSGTTAGGTAVVISGTNFTGATAVTIGGAAAAFTVVNATTLNATTPAHAGGVVNIAVRTPGGTGTGVGLFTYVAPPGAAGVTSVNPTSGPTAGGTSITIGGVNFTGASAVTIGGVAVPAFTVVSATTITTTTPAHAAGAVDVVVTTPNGSETGAGLFTYVAPPAVPTVASIDPTRGRAAGGTVVTITGANFTGAIAVTVGGAATSALTVVSDTTITATTPAHAAGTVDIVVTTPNGAGTGAGLFTYIAAPAAPTIASVNPGSGPLAGGTVITIAGTDFNGASAVSIGGVNALGFTVASDTTITATTAAHEAGAFDVAVTTPNGTGVGARLFTYVAPESTPTKAVETIGGFLGRRNLLLATSEPDFSREIERLLGADRGGDPGASVAGYGSSERMPLTPSLSAPLLAGDQVDFRAGHDVGPPRIEQGWADTRNWQFSTSLSDISRLYSNAQARRAAAAGYRLGVARGEARPNPFDIWVEGTYADFSDNGFASDADGHFGLISLGADYVLNSRLLVGAMAQYDTMSERSFADARAIEGQGWMVGPYATMRLGDNVFWRVRAAWGRSSNDVRPFLTYTDHFDTDRWLVSSRLTGNMEIGNWTVRPFASIFYVEDNAQSYVDSDGLTVPEVHSRFGQITAGPEVSYRYELNDIQLEPHLALSVATTFANEASASGFGRINGDIVGRDDVRARAELGLRATTRGGLALDLSGAYDGIGSDDFEAYSARFTLRVPMN